MVESGCLIAGMALLALSIGVVDYQNKKIKNANKLTDNQIFKIGSQLSAPNPSLEENLEALCKLRRRKAHLQKDIQNCFGSWFLSSILLIFIGISSHLGLGDYIDITKSISAYIFMLSLIAGSYYILRLTMEINRINREDESSIVKA
jgi:hypothetical protein